MDLIALILYGGVNATMVLVHLSDKGRFYQFPFWAGMIALGWFFPQAIGGYMNPERFPPFAYADGMLFATLCTVALWIGFVLATKKRPIRKSWLDASFDLSRLFYSGVFLCLMGFFFQWKLMSLPEEVLEMTRWSGESVKYLFLANIFKIGFITLWLVYLQQARVLSAKYLIFIIPCLLLFLEAAVLRGRRAGMMEVVAYLVVSLWFVRRIAVPRWAVVSGLVFGLILVNGIGVYREIMRDKDIPLSERLSQAADADYFKVSKEWANDSGAEFRNYIFYRYVHADEGFYDYGLFHWNRFVFNYVPAQIVGADFKKKIKYKSNTSQVDEIAEEQYGHVFRTGSTVTGYKDAFGSFGWFGFIKFGLIGYLMGALYRHAMSGAFLGQLLYVYALTKAMQCVSHGSNDILIRVWVYFFVFGYPVLYWAKTRGLRSPEGTVPLHTDGSQETEG